MEKGPRGRTALRNQKNEDAFDGYEPMELARTRCYGNRDAMWCAATKEGGWQRLRSLTRLVHGVLGPRCLPPKDGELHHLLRRKPYAGQNALPRAAPAVCANHSGTHLEVGFSLDRSRLQGFIPLFLSAG